MKSVTDTALVTTGVWVVLTVIGVAVLLGTVVGYLQADYTIGMVEFHLDNFASTIVVAGIVLGIYQRVLS